MAKKEKKYKVQTYLESTKKWWTIETFESEFEASRYILQRYDDKVEANNETEISADTIADYISEQYRIMIKFQ